MPAAQLPPLPYSYDALSSFVDEETMRIHHTKHHQGYLNKLFQATEEASLMMVAPVHYVSQVSRYDDSVRNSLGGYYNHQLFWENLSPTPHQGPWKETDKQIAEQYGDFSSFKALFEEAAMGHFGSGWVWLLLSEERELRITTTPNQDNPLMDILAQGQRGTPLLCLDLWEHAYYLKYQNKRNKYIAAFWQVVSWPIVEKRYLSLLGL